MEPDDANGDSTGKGKGKIVIDGGGRVQIERNADIVDDNGNVVGKTQYRDGNVIGSTTYQQEPGKNIPSKPNSN